MYKNSILQKTWKVITWRWRLQLAINAPFGLLWVADKTNPALPSRGKNAILRISQ